MTDLNTKWGVAEDGRLKSFNVYKDDWCRGQGHAESALLRADGRSCCVGFLARACGMADAEIICKPGVEDIHFPIRSKMNTSLFEPNVDFGNAYVINDDADVNDDIRMRRLTQWFAEHEIQVNFIDGPAPKDE